MSFEDIAPPNEVERLRIENACCHEEIERLRAEVKVWQGHAKTAIWSDSEECKLLSSEVERLLKSRNRWAKKYNDLLAKRRAEDGYDVYAAAREEYRKKIDEQAARIEQLEGQHKGLVLQNALLRQRPDLPVDRIPAAAEVRALIASIEQLEAALREIADCKTFTDRKYMINIARAALKDAPA